MNNTQITGKIVKEYLEDDRWFNLPSLTLAKKIYTENKEAFKSIDSVRNTVRYYRGRIGNHSRGYLADKRFIDFNPYKLPETQESEYFPFILPKEANDILCLSDIHIPYHNIEALGAAIKYGIDQKVNCVLLNGDIWDCYQLSRFVKDPRKRSIKAERDDVKDLLQILRDKFPNALIFYKPGNHEERWEKYMQIKAPELLDMPEWDLRSLLSFHEYGIETITCQKQIIKAGDLNIIHGHEFGMSFFSPVNIARGLFLRAKTSSIQGHNHQTSEHTEADMNGKLTTCWSQGCLCELHPEYLPINKWNHGFAHIKWSEEDFTVKNIRILNGKIV